MSVSPTPPSAVDLPRAVQWEIRGQTLSFAAMPLLMGVVNATPDSFSDGGRYFDREAAVTHGLELVAQGAGILDVGGESTRPGSEPVSADEELRRVIPVVEELARRTPVPLSIDTCKARVAREAAAAGARIINDITGLTGDRDMPDVALATGCGVCAMHMQGRPQTMQQRPVYADVVADVFDYLRARRDALAALGISPQRIALDPGIGFGKTMEHNLALLRSAWRLHSLGCPVLVGPSRKRFIGELLGDPNADRMAGTVCVALALARHGVQVIRVHDVAAVRQALVLFDAAGGWGG
jgi:dihydropteroate synthase